MGSAIAKVFNGTLVPMDTVISFLDEQADVSKVADFVRAAEAHKARCEKADERREYFAEITVWAARRLGEMVQQAQDEGLLRKPGNVESDVTNVTFDQLGLSRMQVSRAKKLAEADEETINDYFADCRQRGREITKGGAVAAAKRAEPIPVVETEVGEWKVTARQAAVKCSAVITDPPYGILDEEWEPDDLESFTCEWLTRWAKKKPSHIVSFFSQEHLFDGRRWFDESLVDYEFARMLVWHYPNGMGYKRGLKQAWEPIFVYRLRGVEELSNDRDWSDVSNLDACVAGAPRPNFQGVAQQRHPCQKPLKVMRWLVAAFSEPDGKVADPFCGSGTTGIAAIQFGRSFHGVETNKEYAELAKQRISAYGENS